MPSTIALRFRSVAPSVSAVAPPGDAALAIAHVLAPGEVGGLESVVAALARGQQSRGHRVTVIACLTTGQARPAFLGGLESVGVQVETVVVAGRAYREERRAVARLLGAARPDVVHTHGYRPDLLHAGPARRGGAAVVTTVHGFTGGGLRNRLYETLQRLAWRRFDAVIGVSGPLAQQLARRGLRASRVHQVPNAYGAPHAPLDRAAARARLGLPARDGFRVGWVGRLSAEKAPDVLVDALDRCDAEIVASVVGDGPERAPLASRTAASGGARVRWHGVVAEAGSLLRAFDVLVLSSRTEGIPVVLLEAMAAGVPIVATRVGGVPEVVTDDEALLVPSEAPEALARAIGAVRDDPAAARVRAERARARLERLFAADAWLDRHDAIYRAALAAQP